MVDVIYELRQYDIPLLRFRVLRNTSDPELEIVWLNEEKRQLLPIGMEPDAAGLASWLKHRTIPKNRAYVSTFLARCGLSPNRPMDVVTVCKGLSLNDSYCVVEEGSKDTFAECNLYTNRFSNILGQIAFTGYGSSVRSSFASSPEFTTNGMLPKCWRRVDGTVRLYKGGTSGASNTGNEPFSEYYSAQVARAMGIDAVEYNLAKWKGMLCSTCALFTDSDHSFVPVSRIVKKGGFEAIAAYYEQLGAEYRQAFADMLVLDAVIGNTDRHFGNFGFIVENRTNTICAPAPLFDHGNGLFPLAGPVYASSPEELRAYADTLRPCAYDSFTDTARQYMTDRNRAQLRSLLEFRFKKHARYNYPADVLRNIETIIRERAAELLQ